MELTSERDLLLEELQDIYSAENQILAALPKMIEKATDEELKDSFTEHLEQTKDQVERLEEIAKALGEDLKGKVCKGMQGVIEEGAEVLKMKGSPSILDLALIGAAQRVEHYEIAAYNGAISLASKIGEDDIVDLLTETRDEEEETSEKLSSIAEIDIEEDEFEEETSEKDEDKIE
jgi:ferritin-like metal-binding protein YciE